MTTAISQARYILLSTKRKSGVFVDTPVWFAGEDNQFYVFSAKSAGKVKRLKNFSEATVAICTVSGKPLGPAIAAKAVVFDDEKEIATAQKMLIKKYGWQMRILDIGSKLTGKYQQRAFIRINLAEGSNNV